MVRLGAQDVHYPKFLRHLPEALGGRLAGKSTPRLFMRERSPAELKALQDAVEQGWAARVTDPIMRVAEKGLQKLPEGKVQTFARKGARLMAEDPVGNLVTNLSPIPGTNPAYLLGKKGLEKVIDKKWPLPA